MKLLITNPLDTIDVRARTPFRRSFLTILERRTPTDPIVKAAKLFTFSLFDNYIFKL